MNDIKFGQCAQCGGNLTSDHKCPSWLNKKNRDLSGKCKHGTSRAKPCGECMRESIEEFIKGAGIEWQFKSKEPLYTLEEARRKVVEEILARGDLIISVYKHTVNNGNKVYMTAATEEVLERLKESE